MKITILGSGSFFIDKDHSAPGYLIQTGGKNILFDCGPGTLNQLAKIDFDPLDLDYIFITHVHNDHTSDLLALLFRPYLSETFYGGDFKKKFVVVGPKGIKEFVSEVAQVFHHNALMKYQKIEYLDFKPEMDFDSFKINVYPVTHLGLDANAIKLTAEGKTFTYTGDAELSPGVIEAAKDVDLLITDAATPKKYPANAHMSTAQVGEICRDNGVKKVILTHQVPLGYNVDMVGEVKEVFDGEIILAKDLMEINL